MTRYCPPLWVTAERDCSVSAGLDTSTVTPGSTPPEVSLTTPAIDDWAYAATGTTSRLAKTTHTRTHRPMTRLPHLGSLPPPEPRPGRPRRSGTVTAHPHCRVELRPPILRAGA